MRCLERASHSTLRSQFYHGLSNFNNFICVLSLVLIFFAVFGSSLVWSVRLDASHEACGDSLIALNHLSEAQSSHCSVPSSESQFLERQPANTQHPVNQYTTHLQQRPDQVDHNNCEQNTVSTRMPFSVDENKALHSEKTDEYCSQLPDHISVHAAHITEVHNVPMRVLIRPIPSVLDETKVASLMETIQVMGFISLVNPFSLSNVCCVVLLFTFSQAMRRSFLLSGTRDGHLCTTFREIKQLKNLKHCFSIVKFNKEDTDKNCVVGNLYFTKNKNVIYLKYTT